MGFKVGMPVLKLKNAKSGGKNRGKAKNSGNLKSVLGEAGTERWSATKTLDRSLSGTNEHLGPYSSGEEAYEAIMDEVEEYSEAYKAEHGRGVRKDAVLAFAMIVKPPAEVVNAMTPEERARFFKDSYDTLVELDVLSDDNVRMRERHRDEGGEHEHIISMAYDKDGKLNGKKVVSLGMFKKLNKEFPKRMQEKGWDVEECEVYDEEAVKKMTPEEADAYKAEHRERKSKQGLSANEYIALKHAEEAEQRAVDAYDMVRQEADLERCSVHVEAQEAYNDAVIEAYAEMEPRRHALKDADKRIAEADEREEAARKSEESAKSLNSQVGLMAVQMNRMMYPDETEYKKHLWNPAYDSKASIEDFREFVSGQGETAKRNARQAQANAREREELARLADDIKVVSAEAGSVPEKTGWMMGWIQQHAPKAYAAAHNAYEKRIKPVIDRVKGVQQRAHQRRVPTGFEDVASTYEHRHDGDKGLGE
ncbi:MAG: plasmid recombination protein [Coriobacteriales bacterium]